MKKLMILVATTMAALSVSANAAPVTSKDGYEYDRNRLSDPSALNWNIEECSHGAITQEAQGQLAKLMGVPEANVRHEFCRRILTAYAKGAIPYEDYVQFAASRVLAPSILRALRIAGSGPRKPQGGGRRPTITLLVKCSDGRTGKAEVTRTPDLMSAWGKVKLSDGSTGRLTVGAVQTQP